jgi:hypothetical protein
MAINWQSFNGANNVVFSVATDKVSVLYDAVKVQASGASLMIAFSTDAGATWSAGVRLGSAGSLPYNQFGSGWTHVAGLDEGFVQVEHADVVKQDVTTPKRSGDFSAYVYNAGALVNAIKVYTDNGLNGVAGQIGLGA